MATRKVARCLLGDLKAYGIEERWETNTTVECNERERERERDFHEFESASTRNLKKDLCHSSYGRKTLSAGLPAFPEHVHDEW